MIEKLAPDVLTLFKTISQSGAISYRKPKSVNLASAGINKYEIFWNRRVKLNYNLYYEAVRNINETVKGNRKLDEVKESQVAPRRQSVPRHIVTTDYETDSQFPDIASDIAEEPSKRGSTRK